MIRPLRIAQIAPIVWRTPPKKYGGTERVINALTEELTKRGHKVTLFATGDSETNAKLSYVFPLSLKEAHIEDVNSFNKWRFLHSYSAYKRENEFDIIHDHTLVDMFTNKTPVVFTHHGLISPVTRDVSPSHIYPVAISNSQRAEAPLAKVEAVVYNGLPMEHYPFSPKPMKYLLFVGRFSEHKGAHLAIEVALALGIKLIMAAKIEKRDEKYFNQRIKPKLGEKIEWIGEVNEEERNFLMSNALCLLHPATWDEPFGLNMIEAMACGCPVVAFNRGSIPEIILDGKTGFIVNNIEEMIKAVKNIGKIKRQNCRTHSLTNFSATRMADNYEKLYYRILRKEVQSYPQREISFI